LYLIKHFLKIITCIFEKGKDYFQKIQLTKKKVKRSFIALTGISKEIYKCIPVVHFDRI